MRATEEKPMVIPPPFFYEGGNLIGPMTVELLKLVDGDHAWFERDQAQPEGGWWCAFYDVTGERFRQGEQPIDRAACSIFCYRHNWIPGHVLVRFHWWQQAAIPPKLIDRLHEYLVKIESCMKTPNREPVWEIRARYETGWEVETQDDEEGRAKALLRDYQQNVPQREHKLLKVYEPSDPPDGWSYE